MLCVCLLMGWLNPIRVKGCRAWAVEDKLRLKKLVEQNQGFGFRVRVVES